MNPQVKHPATFWSGTRVVAWAAQARERIAGENRLGTDEP